MVEDQVRLSNPENGVRIAGQQGCGVKIRSPLVGVKPGSEAWSRLWLEQRGRLSNPFSDLNQAVDLIMGELHDVGYVLGSGVLAAPRRVRKVTRQLGETDIDQLVEVYLRGATVEDAAKQFGVHWTTVLKHLEKRGIPRRGHAKLTAEQIQEIRAMHKIGCSYAEIGRRFGVSGHTVKRRVGKP